MSPAKAARCSAVQNWDAPERRTASVVVGEGDMTELRHDDLDRLVDLVGAKSVAVMTGAGISTDSGIPDYRGKGTPPRTPMSIAQFMEDPSYRRRFWAGARVGAPRHSSVHPNEGHLALVKLEQQGFVSGVITQNVDDLHRQAGSHNLVELHGNGSIVRCTNCDYRGLRSEVLSIFDELNPGYAYQHRDAEIAPDGDASVQDTESVIVPPCPRCGGLLRPNVVYFGELVPSEVFAHAAQIVDQASALVVAGSSLAVNTGMRLIRQAERRALPIAVINRGPTKADTSATVRLEAGTSEVLSQISARLTP